MIDVSVILPTHNPDAGRLRRTLEGVRSQNFPRDRFECLVVDNASSPPVAVDSKLAAECAMRVIVEPELGLTPARKRGFREAKGSVCVLVDDDNVLDASYLENAWKAFQTHERLGALGGRSLPEFETPPPEWVKGFWGLLALRDLGADPIFQQGVVEYPRCAPIGAGMVTRRAAAMQWVDRAMQGTLSDRRGGELTSGGDNDIVLSILRGGWEVGYDPALSLTHLIPTGRLEPSYLARLNHGIQKSWVEALDAHGLRPWKSIPRWALPLRKARAFLMCRGWRGESDRVHWSGICGRLEALAALSPLDTR